MACPYFMPTAKLENGNWPHPRRLPLGCGWSGHCTAPGHEGIAPPREIVETSCNLGYAGGCGWAPTDRACDAVRFAVVAPENLKQELRPGNTPSRILRVTYVYERDHLPAGHGELEFDVADNAWLSRHEDPRIHRMAECFLESYIKKRN